MFIDYNFSHAIVKDKSCCILQYQHAILSGGCHVSGYQLFTQYHSFIIKFLMIHKLRNSIRVTFAC